MQKWLSKFKDPSSEYRGAPFWAWNGKLDPETLRRQVRLMHESKLGGFFMHSRVGLDTKYLSDEWFHCIGACVDEAKKLGMRAWLYDEDRWPSGAAGSIVTKDKRFQSRALHVFVCPSGIVQADVCEAHFGFTKGARVNAELCAKVKTVALFAAVIDGRSASRIRRLPVTLTPQLASDETLLFCVLVNEAPSSWYNGGTSLDMLNPAATKRFIQVTHDAYARKFGEDLGGTIPGIFTDEPSLHTTINSCIDENGVITYHVLAWTDKLPAIFRKLKKYDIVPHIPELIYNVENAAVERARYDFNDCLTEMFTQYFFRQIGEWCAGHNCEFTGHALAEDTLGGQTVTTGSSMRCYEHMQSPGIDVLTEIGRQFQTAKQLSSIAHQFQKKWRLSETYGTTGWDFSFAGHKAVSDWQAALGVNLRCQHLAWYTMRGEAKRDYPASIFHHSPWWRNYCKVEDYFGRINMAMTRGEEVRDILMIHPVESMWVLTSCSWTSDERFTQLESAFTELSDRLLAAHLDFDYGDEEIISRHAKIKAGKDGRPSLFVGKAAYRAVVVPRLLTLRSTTLAILKDFKKAGGTVIFDTRAPELINATPSAEAVKFARKCAVLSGDAITCTLAEVCRRVSISETKTGDEFRPALYLLREDAKASYLFICNTGVDFASGEDISPNPPSFCNLVRDRNEICEDVTLKFYGSCTQVAELDLDSGEFTPVEALTTPGLCTVRTSLPRIASRLFIFFKKAIPLESPPRRFSKPQVISSVSLGENFDYSLSEANVLVLDHPRHKIGDGAWRDELEILRIDEIVRDTLGVPQRNGRMAQPWTVKKKKRPLSLPVTLEYAFDVESIPSGDLFVAIEEPSAFSLEVNGTKVSTTLDEGWWVDESLRKIRLNPLMLREGKNIIRATIDYTEDFSGLEIIYLLGNFGTAVYNLNNVKIRSLPRKLSIGDWCSQGLTFYSGNVSYTTEIRPEFKSGERVFVKAENYRATAIRVLVDDREAGIMAWPPDCLDITDFVKSRQTHRLTLELLGSRRNSHGPLHHGTQWPAWHGPQSFRYSEKNPETWQDSYNIVPCGLMTIPTVTTLQYRPVE